MNRRQTCASLRQERRQSGEVFTDKTYIKNGARGLIAASEPRTRHVYPDVKLLIQDHTRTGRHDSDREAQQSQTVYGGMLLSVLYDSILKSLEFVNSLDHLFVCSITYILPRHMSWSQSNVHRSSTELRHAFPNVNRPIWLHSEMANYQHTLTPSDRFLSPTRVFRTRHSKT